MRREADRFQLGDYVELTSDHVVDYTDLLSSDIEKEYRRRYLIMQGSTGEIIGRPLDFYGDLRYPVRFFNAENFPELWYSGEYEDDQVPRIIGAGHYIPLKKLTLAKTSPNDKIEIDEEELETLFL